MRETEVLDYTDNSELVADQLLGLAGGIMDMMEDKNPNASGVVQISAPEVAEVVEEVEEEEVLATPEPEPPKADKYVIKWKGEDKEVDHAELLELAQKGFDYTEKTQRLAQEKNELSPFIGLANRIKSDPILAAQIAQLMSGQAPTVTPKVAEPISDDPVEQLKADIKNELRREMEAKLEPMTKQQQLDRVKMQVQSDPHFNEIQQDIVKMIQAQPKALQRNMYLQLDQDPESYLQTFKHFKKMRESNPSPVADVPKPTITKTKAPILEAAGISSEAPKASVKEKKAVMDKKKAKALRSGDTQELANWLLESGALEHLY